jgi:hypothetical protein
MGGGEGGGGVSHPIGDAVRIEHVIGGSQGVCCDRASKRNAARCCYVCHSHARLGNASNDRDAHGGHHSCKSARICVCVCVCVCARAHVCDVCVCVCLCACELQHIMCAAHMRHVQSSTRASHVQVSTRRAHPRLKPHRLPQRSLQPPSPRQPWPHARCLLQGIDQR